MKVGVVGLGYVGLPLLVEMARSGFEAIGIDVDPKKVDAINAGKSYIEDVPEEDVRLHVTAGKLRATSDWDVVRDLDAVSICVPTPLRKTKDPDISYIVSASDQIAPRLHKGQIIILESTTYPGTTDELLLPKFERPDFKVGHDFFLAFSPERVDPGNKKFTTRNTPKIIGGVTSECTRRCAEYYSKIFDTVVPVSSSRCAEMVKLLENTFRSVNIGLVNEVAVMCDKLGLDVWEVIAAAATKPFGFMPFYPGPGLGGHCIPIDPHYLAWKLKTLNYTARFIELASEINGSMPHFVVDKVVRALNDDKKPVHGSKILILGVAYKPNVSDVRESPALDIIGLLTDLKATVSYHDPYVPELREGDHSLTSVPLNEANLKAADCVIIVTNHAALDYKLVGQCARLVVDTRNAMKEVPVQGRLVKL
ncbi:MAG: nucleotide sugar dehydrogenase [Candidatus Hydrogenedentota bacterium]|jgi:UDP-N-acetyl-D-glucosamine dehydrogenase|uniref:UDP-glucose dehydrogenase n=1 Tax=Sumerlaea chitinivorans TaxID=2250252 RepID=A0A2Z4Y2Z6_SUMC1|nr:UDP-glucose dehydrogenase [Candidatus Sumerlaea chitinivorans]RMH27598.1 MAG: nucleotide sugar dehydrogenase [Candidatus Hydrogenedentota bacterium]GIX44569.1 MAG: UDP-N-acetyl-D-glucosamine dehydrogenase [Candidatus Sumerlaea sp.]